ncbi:MAG TPA: universal stress protein [Candidatus Hydrogenedentes bacterium]|nr:universal stress protein [Candidatus Hydrogenedentota bacterium]HPG66853.1 universal stress protein [Candidatus Hydrogenedentota bacterium]
MKQFKRILVCVDLKAAQHPVLERAIKLAQNNEAELRVVAVQERLPTWARALLPAGAQDWEEIVEQEARGQLERLIAPLEKTGVSACSAVLSGQPFVEIIREVSAHSHDLVLKDLELDRVLGKPMISSTDMHLLRKSPCPVWLIQPNKGKPFARILAAVDPVPGDDDVRNSLNTRILELATSLALQEQCRLFVVRAYESVGEAFLATKVNARDSSEFLERIQMVRMKSDREFIGKFEKRAGEFDVRYVHGNPGAIIPEVVRDEAVDLVIMGTVARTGIPGLLMGRTAEAVLRQVDCSVLGVKPKGFVSPL